MKKLGKREAKRIEIVRKAEVALGELRLSILTKADLKRVARIEKGLKALDDEQAEAKEILEKVLEADGVSEHVPDELWRRAVKFTKGQ